MILAIDQGTTGTTCLVFDAEGRIAGRAYSEFEQHFPRPGWVEHDADGDLGGDAAGRGARRSPTPASRARELDGDRDHQPARDRGRLGPGDRRADPPRAGLAGPPHRRALRRAAGGGARGAGPRADRARHRPLLLGTKIEWLLRNAEGAERAVFGTIDSWLLFKLTGRHATDYSNASRTMLFDIRRLAWDEELCELLGVDPARLPEPLPSAHVYGTTGEFGGEVPVAGIAGDQQAALFGQACHRAGMAKNTYGTGSFVLLNTGAAGARAGRRPADHRRLGPARRGRLRARGLDLRHRRRGAVAARRARDDRRGGGDARRWPPRSTATTASTSSPP